ncbi:lipopolysaccharide heptosyltransferase I [Formosimonas limnophila]|uniref:Lipopolysaccharide heptosyltransferase 1 n=1 Tax=Formosimonas limnophila TaxID=1384487 RepID=A0A8J3G0A0_9BURK|nr:lipopolysaccharide heptosyltransferase I [Formosimonas limnophila]GHA71374.1 lipopolysaccharide heptosyltransferase I [Formosimonas limnophila]
MKILIIKMSSMGDVIHALPVLSDILQHYPNAQIDWVVEQSFADLVRANAPLVRRVIPIRLRAWRKTWREAQTRKEWRAFKSALQSEAYDVVIDCQGLFKSAVVARLARLMPNGRRVGYDTRSIRESIASWFYQDKCAVSLELPAVLRNRTLVSRALGYSLDGCVPRVEFPTLAQYLAARDDWQNPDTPYAVLVPNASRVEKRWADAHWRAVAAQCHAVGLHTLWFWGGADECVYTEHLLAGLPEAERAFALLPPFLTIPQAAQCMQSARCVIGLDSGLTHLSAALGRPTLGIYCDHDAALAPMTAHTQGADFVASLGGVGQPPSLESVQAVLARWLSE